VRIARYLDALALAQGGTRRPELISEAELRARHDDLDFEWEDDDEPDAEVAAALGVGVSELQALRTPVPRDGTNWARRPHSHLPLPAPALGESYGGDESYDSATNPMERIDPADLSASGSELEPTHIAAPPEPPPAPVHLLKPPAQLTVGAGMLANAPRKGAPWLIVAALALAVIALVVYILV
jgi:hypothetical protein